jgi:hypothetical protein
MQYLTWAQRLGFPSLEDRKAKQVKEAAARRIAEKEAMAEHKRVLKLEAEHAKKVSSRKAAWYRIREIMASDGAADCPDLARELALGETSVEEAREILARAAPAARITASYEARVKARSGALTK